MIEKQKKNQAEELSNQKPEELKSERVSEGEFKVTVRKLEMPVRPRGVLAE